MWNRKYIIEFFERYWKRFEKTWSISPNILHYLFSQTLSTLNISSTSHISSLSSISVYIFWCLCPPLILYLHLRQLFSLSSFNRREKLLNSLINFNRDQITCLDSISLFNEIISSFFLFIHSSIHSFSHFHNILYYYETSASKFSKYSSYSI